MTRRAPRSEKRRESSISTRSDGLFAPSGMSAETREKIAADVRAVAESDPTIAQRLESTGQVLDLQGPKQFTASIKELRDKLSGIARLVGMKPGQ